MDTRRPLRLHAFVPARPRNHWNRFFREASKFDTDLERGVSKGPGKAEKTFKFSDRHSIRVRLTRLPSDGKLLFSVGGDHFCTRYKGGRFRKRIVIGFQRKAKARLCSQLLRGVMVHELIHELQRRAAPGWYMGPAIVWVPVKDRAELARRYGVSQRILRYMYSVYELEAKTFEYSYHFTHGKCRSFRVLLNTYDRATARCGADIMFRLMRRLAKHHNLPFPARFS